MPKNRHNQTYIIYVDVSTPMIIPNQQFYEAFVSIWKIVYVCPKTAVEKPDFGGHFEIGQHQNPIFADKYIS